MKKNKVLLSGFVALLVIVLAFFCIHSLKQNDEPQKEASVSGKTATVFFHGYGSSRNAEKSMAQYLVDHGYSNRRINVTVSKDGKVSMGRAISKNDKNPLVLVQFDDNTNTNFNESVKWTTEIMEQLKKEGVDSVNLVGHSMGNQEIAYYLMKSDSVKQPLPIVKKQIAIAAPFNGVIVVGPESGSTLKSNGEPSQPTILYQRILPLRDFYKRHKVAVLNIFGNSQGNPAGDTTVYNKSSKSLKYLVQSPSSYKEKLITGALGQHSKLHENSEVDAAMLDFLEQ
ncbi:alpha/beta hydrolase [Eupransor demetentiae]|uniref:Uncharacterized conserved protein with an alpha/beta hydrolase fold n=1 Tax=Eupransor demetentiae TaxID=3109584 RepID=A0ABP0ES03_9LACO|nr:Uncharacterized conserved protein with an alpha/beta hydrolase fold [Lactobacillaceae bacterium LMG 33000]